MARILVVGFFMACSLMLGQSARAQSSAPDIEFSLFGGIPVSTRFDFPGLASTLNTGAGRVGRRRDRAAAAAPAVSWLDHIHGPCGGADASAVFGAPDRRQRPRVASLRAEPKARS